jgi:integrase
MASERRATWRAIPKKPGLYRRHNADTGEPWDRRNGKPVIRLVFYKRGAEGKLVQSVEHFDSQKAAEARRDELRHNANRGLRESVAGSQMTVQELYEAYPTWRAARGLESYSPKTEEMRAGYWKHVPDWLRERKIKDVEDADIDEVCGAIAGAETRRKVRGMLSQMYAAAIKRRAVHYNPAAGGSAAAPKRDHRILEPSELKRLIRATPDRYKALVEIIGRVGLRPDEAFGLTVGQVKVGRLTIDRTLSRETTKTGKARTFAIPADLSETLAAHIERYSSPKNRSELVFTSDMGKPIDRQNFTRRVLRSAAEEAGLDPDEKGRRLRPYDLRHTACSNALIAGIDPATVAQMAGHTVAVLLSTYAHRSSDAEEAAAARLGAMWEAIPDSEEPKVVRLRT